MYYRLVQVVLGISTVLITSNLLLSKFKVLKERAITLSSYLIKSTMAGNVSIDLFRTKGPYKWMWLPPHKGHESE